MAFIQFHDRVDGRSGIIVGPDVARSYMELKSNPQKLLRLSKKRQRFVMNIKNVHTGTADVDPLPSYQRPVIPGSAVYDARYR